MTPVPPLFVAVAGAIFWWRKQYRYSYAIAEMAFGAVAGWFAFSKMMIGSGDWRSTLVGSLFIIVSGCDNLDQRRKERAEAVS